MAKEKQLAFIFRSHGGFRKRAGRKRRLESDPSHTTRARIDSRTPAHVTLKLVEQVPNLRDPKFLGEFTRAVKRAQKFGLRIQHFVLETNHIHLVAETDNNHALSRGMLSLKTSIAWALRKVFLFHGSVFKGRYHLRLLKTPTEMRNVLKYVIFNHAHHCGKDVFADVYSTVFEFTDPQALVDKLLRGSPPRWQEQIKNCLIEARSWMQREGWRRGRV